MLQGDTRAAAEMVEQLAQPLYAFCLPRVGRKTHLCEDVVQEAMLQALRQLPAYEPDRCEHRLLPWLVGLARNEIRRVNRQQTQMVSVSQLGRHDEDACSALERLCAEVGEESDPETRQTLEETIDDMQSALTHLPEHYQQILQAKYVNGLSMQAIAEQRQCTEKAVESLLTRARAALRKAWLQIVPANVPRAAPAPPVAADDEPTPDPVPLP